jgi:hypothetical protein
MRIRIASIVAASLAALPARTGTGSPPAPAEWAERADSGSGAVFNYRLDRQGEWRVNGSVLFDATVYAVDAGVGGATLRDERVPMTVGIECRSKGGLRIQGYGGVVAWRRWELDAGSGEDAAWRGDPGVVFGLEGGTMF